MKELSTELKPSVKMAFTLFIKIPLKTKRQIQLFTI